MEIEWKGMQQQQEMPINSICEHFPLKKLPSSRVYNLKFCNSHILSMQSNNIIEFVQKLHLCMCMQQHVSNKSIYRLQLSDMSFWTRRNFMPQQQQQLQLIEILRAIRL